MRLYKITLRLKSSLGTPLMSDTVFGHICWSIRYNKSEKELTEFLKKMKSDNPPLLLSDAFRKDCLPVPVLPNVVTAEKSVEESDRLKKAKKQKYIKSDRLFEIADSLSGKKILNELLEFAVADTKERYLVPHNTVNRLGAGTVENGLFFTEDAFFKGEDSDYEMIIGSDAYSKQQTAEMLELAFRDGYGRDASTGKGVIEVADIEDYSMPKVKNPNAVMLLGRCVPAENDPAEGYWNLTVKEGKLGGHWAVCEDFRKKPVIMLSAGSVLFTDTPKPYYGKIVENVHNDLSEVVQYGYSLAMPINLQESEVA